MVRIKQDLVQIKEDNDSKTENIIPESPRKLSRSTSMKVTKIDRSGKALHGKHRHSLGSKVRGSPAKGKSKHSVLSKMCNNETSGRDDSSNDDLASITNVTPSRVKKLHIKRLSNEKYCIGSSSSDDETSPLKGVKHESHQNTESRNNAGRRLSKPFKPSSHSVGGGQESVENLKPKPSPRYHAKIDDAAIESMLMINCDCVDEKSSQPLKGNRTPKTALKRLSSKPLHYNSSDKSSNEDTGNSSDNDTKTADAKSKPKSEKPVITSNSKKLKREETKLGLGLDLRPKRSANKPLRYILTTDDDDDDDKDSCSTETGSQSIPKKPTPIATPKSRTPVRKSSTKKLINQNDANNSRDRRSEANNDSNSNENESRSHLRRSAKKTVVSYCPSSDEGHSSDDSNARSKPTLKSRISNVSRTPKSNRPVERPTQKILNYSLEDESNDSVLQLKETRKPAKTYRSESSDSDISDDSEDDVKLKRKSKRTPLKRPARYSRVGLVKDGDKESPRTPRAASALDKTPKSSTRRLRVELLTPSMPQRVGSIVEATTPLEKARERLHVSAVPDVLLCREAVFQKISLFLEGRIADKCGGSMYISGVPGTGKTATVRHVIAALRRRSETPGDVERFRYVEVNGMRMTTPHQLYVQLHQELEGEKAPWERAMRALEKRFTQQKQKLTTIVLVDELDLICNKRQDIIYNLLDWPRKPSSRLVVLTIANTMDLPEKLLSAKVTSRMGLNRTTFKPYSSAELEQIVAARLDGIGAFEADAVRLVAKKVASISGDCRRALDICRRATEVAETESLPTEPPSNTPRKTKPGTPQKTKPQRPVVMVTMAHVQAVLEEMMSSHKIKAIRGLSAMEQLFLRAVATSVEHGTDQTEFHAAYPNMQLLCTLEGVKIPTVTDVLRICQRLSSVRMIICQKPRHDVRQKILLNCDADDIHWALTNINNVR